MSLNDHVLSPDEIRQLTEADWRERLSPEEYHILREKGTERAFTGFYTDVTDKGIYRCKGCNAQLFNSDNKFHSGCGWPSFDKTINDTAITESLDTSHGMRRIEVTCSNCGSHLGHVFPDGPRETTGMRYCINSLAVSLDEHE
ncbi:MAG: peptide-methionine (R)-S-oxide reductase MsrB [Moraxella sp.]|nr:peptide-methionine (R)-S-oxide reductase MsrB [Moraxella sp.]